MCVCVGGGGSVNVSACVHACVCVWGGGGVRGESKEVRIAEILI